VAIRWNWICTAWQAERKSCHGCTICRGIEAGNTFPRPAPAHQIFSMNHCMEKGKRRRSSAYHTRRRRKEANNKKGTTKEVVSNLTSIPKVIHNAQNAYTWENAGCRMCASLYELVAKCGPEFESQKMTETKKLVTEIKEQLRKRSLRPQESGRKNRDRNWESGSGAETERTDWLRLNDWLNARC